MASTMLNEGDTMETVVKNIYSSCDPDNSNLVPVSRIIEFITPYMLQDLAALESLRTALDPQNKNVCLNSEQFYEAMNEWTKKIENLSSDDTEFNRTQSNLEVIDDKQLPYTQSTPRASFGQKLLRCEGLLNLSNVSGYSLSTSMQIEENGTGISEKTILEEEIKRLEHQLNRVSNEMIMVKLQLTATEEQNDVLQADLDRCKTRLHSEQQIIDHLQNDMRYNDELREELNISKRQLEELNKKVLQYEKDNNNLQSMIKQTEGQNAKLEERCTELSRREQEAKKEIIDVRAELDVKDQEIATIVRINEELRSKLNEQRDIIDQLTNENELLLHKKNTLDKALRGNMSARSDSIVSQYKMCLADSSSYPNPDQGSEEECDFKIHDAEFAHHTQDSLQAEISQVVSDTGKDYSILSFEKNEKICELEEKAKVIIERCEDEISQLRSKNGAVQARLDIVNQENEKLCLRITEMKDKIVTLEQDVHNLVMEKKEKESNLRQIQLEKSKIENAVKQLEEKNSALTDENNNLIQKNKSVNGSLEVKNKILEELEEKLLDLKREFAKLQTENITKEKELCKHRNRFNFEKAYKTIQVELTEKNNEILELSKSNEELKVTLNKVTNANQDLEKSLRQAEAYLQENEDRSSQLSALNGNIEQTANLVQFDINRKNTMITELVELNKQFKSKILTLQEDLQRKVREMAELSMSLRSDMKIKNAMWRDNKDLEREVNTQIDKNKELSGVLTEVKRQNKEDYDALMTKYNEELEKICGLTEQNNRQEKELAAVLGKYNDEVRRNQKLYEQVTAFKNDIDKIKNGQNEYNNKINKKLEGYEDLINNLEKKLQEVRLQNNTLQAELAAEKKKPKKERFFDFDVSTAPDNSKNRSFEKQKLVNDRLKERLEKAEALLQQEKLKTEMLRAVVKEREQMEEKYSKAQLDYEQAQLKSVLEKQELQEAISDLTDKLKDKEERCVKLENICDENEKVLSVKLSQMELLNQQLYITITNKDFVLKNVHTELEKSTKKVQELSKRLSQQESKIHALNAEVAEKKSLSVQILDLRKELSKSSDELTQKHETIVNLEQKNKSLLELMSKSDDHKEKELLNVEQKITTKRKLLQGIEIDLSLIEKRISEAKDELAFISTQISEHKDRISRDKKELSRASSLALNKWEDELEQEDIYKELLALKECQPSEKGDGLYELHDKIKFAVLMLELLASKAPTVMEDSELSVNNLPQHNTSDPCPLSDAKMIKKFTLRPPRLLISRPVSPDSPSVDIEGINGLSAYSPQQIIFNTSKEIYGNKIQECHMYQDSPYKEDDSYETACENISLSQYNDPFELISYQDAFLNVSDTFLEKLGLRESSPKQTLSREETEQLFTSFAIQIALDSKDIKERLEKQKERCKQQHEKFLLVVKDISQRLRDHRCIGAVDPIGPVFVLLEDLKFLLNDVTQSVGHFGILTCENRMMKCWNLVTNYMAILKQDAVNSESTVKQNQNEVKTCSFGDKLRRRLLYFHNKEDSSKIEVSPENSEVPLIRYKCVPSGRTLITLAIFSLFLFLFLLVWVHWQCRMSAAEKEVCILDDVIKKVNTGNPPY